jgi:phage protein U
MPDVKKKASGAKTTVSRRPQAVVVTSCAFVAALIIIVFLVTAPQDFFKKEAPVRRISQIVTPQSNKNGSVDNELEDYVVSQDATATKLTMEEGEIPVASLMEDINVDSVEEQIVAYRNMLEPGNPIYLCLIEYEQESGSDKRVQSIASGASRAGTISLFTKDLLGDRSTCVILTGLDAAGRQTLLVCRYVNKAEAPLEEIANITGDGSISIMEQERSQAYQRGLAAGKSFDISLRELDSESDNEFDEVEVTWAYNPLANSYEKAASVKIKRTQIEQQRYRELLSGKPGPFEKFISGLWYHVNSQSGMIDKDQYIYFDPGSREIIFYEENTQQVFDWKSSNSTRVGLYVASDNISVGTLRRFIDIELDKSLESLRITVSEDVRMKISLYTSWNGTYKMAAPVVNKKRAEAEDKLAPYLDASYDSLLGRLSFTYEGRYSLESGTGSVQGHYAIIRIDGQEILELFPTKVSASIKASKQTYLIERLASETPGTEAAFEGLRLKPVRLGTMGVVELRESAIPLTPATASLTGATGA